MEGAFLHPFCAILREEHGGTDVDDFLITKEVTYDSNRRLQELDVLALRQNITLWTHCASGYNRVPVRLSDAMELIDRTTDFIVVTSTYSVDDLATSSALRTSNSSTMSMNPDVKNSLRP